MREWILVLFATSLCFEAFAASPYKRSLTQKNNAYVSDGVFIGGEANNGTSILALRREFSPKIGIERVVVDIGNKEAKPDAKDLGYFQVSMDPQNQRIVLDITQLRISKLSEQQIQEAFKKSPLVKSAELTLDPEDQSASLVLNLKQPAKLEVFQIRKSGKPARVVMDIKAMAKTNTQTKPKRG